MPGSLLVSSLSKIKFRRRAMDRRSIFRASLAALAVPPPFGRTAGAATEKKQHKTAIHHDQNDPPVVLLALGYTPHHQLMEPAPGPVARICNLVDSPRLHTP